MISYLVSKKSILKHSEKQKKTAMKMCYLCRQITKFMMLYPGRTRDVIALLSANF